MHIEEKIKVKCSQCGSEFETRLEFYYDSYFVRPFCCDSCRNTWFSNRQHPENCQCERCTKRDASD